MNSNNNFNKIHEMSGFDYMADLYSDPKGESIELFLKC